jgi:hypothetical protein
MKIYVITRSHYDATHREFEGITTSYEDAVEFIKKHSKPWFNKGRWDESHWTAPSENHADESWHIRTSEDDSYEIYGYNVDNNYNVENYKRFINYI